MGWYSYNNWPRYVSVAERRRKAAKKIAKMKKAGRDIAPVEIIGRKIATTFWGDAWCKNLEAYSDYANRLPRGRTYVRNGSVIDLQIEAGRVRALVSGSDIYEVDIRFKPLAKKRWTDIKGQCAGQIGSLVELLQGSVSKGVMEIVTRKGQGLFPSPQEISLNCSCPDWATMCKHVAATLYGVGACLDHKPELLFTLRGVDPTEMVEAAIDQPPTGSKPRRGRALKSDELSSVFGVDIDMGEVASADVSARAKPGRKARRTKGAKRKTSRRNVKKTETKPVAKKKTTKKTTPRKKAAAKRDASKKTSTKKAATKKPSARRAAVKKTTAQKSTAEKAGTPKTTAKKRISKKRPTAEKAGKTTPEVTT